MMAGILKEKGYCLIVINQAQLTTFLIVTKL